jgi:undecaprenyl-diphosphatase
MDSIIIFLGKYLIVFIVLLALYAIYAEKNRREVILAILLAGFLAWLLSGIAGALYVNPRPFVEHNVQPLLAHGADNGFPSQHALLAMTLTSVIYFYRRRLAAVMFVMALLVGAGRVWAHVHSWIDIAGGLAIGAAAGATGVMLARYILPKISAKKPKAHH